MSIERTCENCKFYDKKYDYCGFSDMSFEDLWTDYDINKDKSYYANKCYHFTPFEWLIREDERNKIITLLKSDLENFDGLAEECVERKDIHELLENNAVRKYIESVQALLGKEK